MRPATRRAGGLSGHLTRGSIPSDPADRWSSLCGTYTKGMARRGPLSRYRAAVSRSEVIERWIQRVLAVDVLVQASVVTANATSEPRLYLVSAVLAAVFVRFLAVKGTGVDLGLMTGSLALMLLTDVIDRLDGVANDIVDQSSTLLASHALLLAVAVCIAVLRPTRWWIGVFVASCAFYSAVAITVYPAAQVLAEVITAALGAAVGSGSIAFSLRRSARRSDAAADEARLAYERRVEDLATEVAAQETGLLLHDHLIGSLTALRHDPPTALRREISANALQTLAEFLERPETERLVTLRVDLQGVAVELDDARDAAGPRLPGHVWAAVCDATHEALRNVRRHSGTDRAQVSIRGDARSITVEVRDEGVGFDTSEAAGFGTAQSITARMESVGGAATIESNPGQGTTVRLRWSDAREDTSTQDRWSRIRESVGDPRALTLGMPLGQSIGVALQAMTASGPQPLATAAVFLLTSAVVIVLLRRSLRGPFSRRLTWGAMLTAPALTALGLWVAGSGSLLGHGSWIVGFVSWGFFVPMGLYASRWSLWASVAATTGIIIVAASFDPNVSAARAINPATLPATYALVFALAGRAVLSIGAGASRSHTAAVQDTIAGAAARRRRDLLAERLRGDLPRVDAVLRAIADSPEGPLAEDIRRECAVLAGMARDELLHPGRLDDATRAAIATLRGAGTEVSIRDLPHEDAFHAASDLLVALATSGHHLDAVVVNSRPSEAHDVSIVVRPAVSTSFEHTGWHLVDHGDLTAYVLSQNPSQPASALSLGGHA